MGGCIPLQFLAASGMSLSLASVESGVQRFTEYSRSDGEDVTIAVKP